MGRKRKRSPSPCMQSEEEIDGEREEQLRCTCLIADDCELHDLTPEKRLNIMDGAILKAQKLLDGQPIMIITPTEYMNFFSCAFALSSIRHYSNYAGVLYERFIGALQDSIVSVVLPSLQGKENIILLTGIVEIWPKYKTMGHWLVRFCTPLKTYCSTTKGTELDNIPVNLFCDWVFDPLWGKLRDEVMRLIKLERGGMAVNRNLLKGALDMFMEIENKGRRNYYRNFELLLLADTGARYLQLASEWLLTHSLTEYIRKALRYMGMEERRMSYYLPETTLASVLEIIRYELMDRRTMDVVELVFREFKSGNVYWLP